MTRGAKMLMLANNRNRSNRGESREGQMNENAEMRGYDRDRKGRFTGEMEMNRTYEYGPRNAAMREAEGNYGPQSNYDMDSRFRDRRGREHYDDGRFAPTRSEMQAKRWYPPYYDVDINRYEYEAEQPESRGGRMNRGGYDADSRMPRYEGGNDRMRIIGFDRPENNEMRMGSDASIPHYREMDRMKGNKAVKGGASSQSTPMFDEHMAKEWSSMMENEDGTKGPHWSMDQVKKVMEQKEMTGDPIQTWITMNMMYSDYCKAAKKLGVNNMDFYTEMSKAFLEDKDAGASDKLAAYYENIVKGK